MKGIIDHVILDEVEATVTSEKFAQYLLSNTVNFMSCAFIVQTLMDAIKEAREKLDGPND